MQIRTAFIPFVLVLFGLNINLKAQTTHTVSVKINQPVCNPLNVGENLVMQAFPNPVETYLSLTNLSTDATISILDFTGRSVKEMVEFSDRAVFMGDLPKGVYFIQVFDSHTNSVKVFKVYRK